MSVFTFQNTRFRNFGSRPNIIFTRYLIQQNTNSLGQFRVSYFCIVEVFCTPISLPHWIRVGFK